MTVDINDMYVQKWLTGLSDKTKLEYPKLIGDWFNFLGMTPTEIVNKRMKDRNSEDLLVKNFFEDKWKEYKAYLESGENSDSKVHDRLKVASSFFSRNFGKESDGALHLVKGNWKSTQKQEVKEKKEKLTLEDIKRLYAKADLRDKCILLILSQSGFSEVDISLLKIEDIENLYNLAINEHYVIEKGRDKTCVVQATCLSYEFLHDLRLQLEEKGNPSTGYIFTSQTKDKGIEKESAHKSKECGIASKN
jgi:integrase